MLRPHRIFIAFVAALLIQSLSPQAAPDRAPTIGQFISPAYPFELVSAKKADRLAWIAYDRGLRNIYTAAAPDFRPVRLTRFLDDNGVDLSGLNISDDGSVVTFVRGTAPNREGWIANPTSSAAGADRTVWAAPTAGGVARRIGEATNPTLSPDGRSVVFARDGQIYQYRVTQAAGEVRLKSDATNVTNAANSTDAGKLLIKAWGTNSNPRWSPDSAKIAFVSSRVDHSFIGVYDVRSRAVTFLSPSVDHDTSPTWSRDSKRIAFIRRPGTPFGQQAQQGTGSLGNPSGPAFNPAGRGQGQRGRGQAPAAQAGQRGQGGQRGGGRPSTLREPQGRPEQGRGTTGSGQAAGDTPGAPAPIPGLTSATFKGGYAQSFWVADAATGDAHEFWHPAPSDPAFPTINSIQWAGDDRVIFSAEPEEWIRYHSVRIAPESTEGVSGGAATPTVLTPGEGMVENIGLSSDGRFLYYTTNAGDIERRHVWKVPAAGGEAVQVTRGDGIETYPAALASGKQVAVLSAGARVPQSVGLVAVEGGAPTIIFPTLPKDFPLADHVVPENVITKAADGLEIHNQLFLPKDLKPGEKRPAIIFVHGGPVRQMLLGYHYMHFYHLAYAANQWLASQGYVVLSVNFRSGIGYGKSFRTAPNTGGRGNAEYQDVVTGGKYLQGRPDVDPKRVGIWGLSYGGVLTAQALARNSDIFVAGVDLAGVHLWGGSIDPENVSYQSSAIAAIDKWKSPVLLVHGDDDRNVNFAQTVGLVQLLRAHDVHHELIVFPDDTHESLLHKRWIYTFDRMDDFLRRFLRGEPEKRISTGKQ